MSDSKNKFHVGQQLYWVYNDSRHGRTPQFIEVTSVGRKWIGIGHLGRIDAQSLVHDAGQYSPRGRCYFTKEEHDAIEEHNDAWREFWNLVRNSYSAPKHLTTEQIRSAIALLEPPKESP